MSSGDSLSGVILYSEADKRSPAHSTGATACCACCDASSDGYGGEHGECGGGGGGWPVEPCVRINAGSARSGRGVVSAVWCGGVCVRGDRRGLKVREPCSSRVASYTHTHTNTYNHSFTLAITPPTYARLRDTLLRSDIPGSMGVDTRMLNVTKQLGQRDNSLTCAVPCRSPSAPESGGPVMKGS